MNLTKEALKRHLISLGITFVSAFFLVMSFQISDPEFIFSVDSLRILAISALIAGARAVAKLVYEMTSQLVK